MHLRKLLLHWRRSSPRRLLDIESQECPGKRQRAGRVALTASSHARRFVL
jgi:hypothetical protein